MRCSAHEMFYTKKNTHKIKPRKIIKRYTKFYKPLLTPIKSTVSKLLKSVDRENLSVTARKALRPTMKSPI